MSLTYRFDPGGGNELTLTPDDIVRQNPVRAHTGLSDFRATVTYNRDLEQFAQRQDRLNVEIDGSVEWTGYVIEVTHSEREATTDIVADGIAKRLEETRPDYESIGGPVVYQSIALEDAIDDYWSRTPFGNVTVTTQSTETVATDATLQSADTTTEWDDVTPSFAADAPVGVSNGELTLLQSLYFDEFENEPFQGNSITDSKWSDGEAIELVDGNDNCNIDFTLEYDIPLDDLQVQVRQQIPNAGNPPFDVNIDGTTVASRPANSLSQDSSPVWESYTVDPDELSGDVLSAGSHTLEIAATDGSGDLDPAQFDCAAVYDDGTRSPYGGFSYTFDDTTNANEALSGPELYPDGVTVTLTTAKAGFNITEATVNITIDDTSGQQAIGISFDGGSTFDTASNTDTHTVQSTSGTRTATVRFTLDRYGSRTSTTPTEGYLGQSIDVYDLLVDGNNLVVVDNLELSRNHFENLQQLHNYGNFLWVIEHSSDSVANMPVTSFREGDETRPAPAGFDDPQNQTPKVNSGAYFNSVYVQGAEDSSGNRPAEEAKDSAAISNDGREISPGVLRDPKVATEAGAAFRARSLLDSAQDENTLKGSVTVPPTITDPGYARPVDFGDGEQHKTVERVSLTESPGDVQAVFELTPPDELVDRVSSLRRNARDVSDQV